MEKTNKAFELQNKIEIQNRIIKDIKESNNNTSLIEGTFKRDLINANALEFEKAYTEMNLLKEACFASTSWGDYLTLVCSDYGIDRKPAEKAKGVANVTGAPRALIPSGSLFQTQSGLRFYTLEDGFINDTGKADLKVIAEKEGAIYNIQPGTLNLIPMSISGVYSVNNEAVFKGGYDQETDAQLYKRYYDKIRTPATSGNIYHYKQWALSVAGVGNCRVYPLKNGNGTVEVAIVDSNGTRANSELLERVKKYIESVRPIGATVSITTPDPLQVTIKVSKAENVNKEEFKAKLIKFFSDEGFNIEKISKAMISKALLNSGCTDYEEILINDQAKNIELNYKLPVLKEVIYL